MVDRDLSIDEILELTKHLPTEWQPAKRNKQMKICPRCNGRKVIAQYAHYKNGKCFVCKGKGTV